MLLDHMKISIIFSLELVVSRFSVISHCLILKSKKLLKKVFSTPLKAAVLISVIYS